MNNQAYNFQFVWLNDAGVAHNQSRGLSLQVNGWAPISLPKNDENYFIRLLQTQAVTGECAPICKWNPISSYKEDNVITMLKDYKYSTAKITSDDGLVSDIAKTVDASYNDILAEYYNHMFTDVNMVAANELPIYDEDAKRFNSAVALEFTISDTMFGKNLTSENGLFIDAIVFFGQSYNTMGNDETAQGTLERTVPIALLVYTDPRFSNGTNRRPQIITNLPEKVSLRERISISLIETTEGPAAGDEWTEQSSLATNDLAYKDWNSLGASMHLVNDAATLDAAYVINNDGIDVENYDFVTNASDVGMAMSRSLTPEGSTLMTKSRMQVHSLPDYDWNQDFGSPAQLTVVASARSDNRKHPQTLISKAEYKYAQDGTRVSGTWDGVAQTVWQSITPSAVKSSIYSTDYISKAKPGVEFFAEDSRYEYLDANLGKSTSAYSFNGTNILTFDSFAALKGINVNTNGCNNIGSNLMINASKTKAIWRTPPVHSKMFGGLYVNTTNVTAGGSYGASIMPTYAHTVLGAEGVFLGVSKNITQIEKTKRNRIGIFNSNSIRAVDCDHLTCIGTKGREDTKGNKWYWSDGEKTKNTVVIGGTFQSYNANSNVIIGVNTETENTIHGGSNDKNTVENSVIIGADNQVVSYYDYNATQNGHSQKNIYMFGKGLKSDPYQQAYDNNKHITTIITGQYNNVYTQRDPAYGVNGLLSAKQFIIGGFVPKGHGGYTGDWVERYNVLEVAPVCVDPFDAAITVADCKGRSVDYGTRGIIIGMVDEKSQNALNRYRLHSLGSINWSKFYQLLRHLYWDKRTGVVHFDTSATCWSYGDDSVGFLDEITWPTLTDGCVNTSFARLVHMSDSCPAI